jgi:FMN phosphatase YigB (HAD superfamily)
MALSLEQYATYLDTRDLPWPAAPLIEPANARPCLTPLADVRVVLWSVYGTLLAISGGDLAFEHPQPFVMNVALDKAIQEFKMWTSMSRKPGQPAEYLKQIYGQLLQEHRSFPGGGERHPEVASDRLWEAILKRLLQKDYQFDSGFYGSLNEFSRKVAYFFHASLQGTACYPGAAAAIKHLADRKIMQGILGDGQCFTSLQLQRGLKAQDAALNLAKVMNNEMIFLSYEGRGKKPSERLFGRAMDALKQKGIQPNEVLHVGARLTQDLVPARRLGMRTALYAGDQGSLQATAEQLRELQNRPDVLLTNLEQIKEVVGNGSRGRGKV